MMIREDRYIVLKKSDVAAAGLTLNLDEICHRVSEARRLNGKQPLECVVVESDWPVYESAWKLIENYVDSVESKKVVDSMFAQSPAGDPDLVRNKPYFYVVGDKLVCTDAYSIERLTRYHGYDYVILSSIGNNNPVNQIFDSSGLSNSSFCVRVTMSEIVEHRDNLEQIIKNVHAQLLG